MRKATVSTVRTLFFLVLSSAAPVLAQDKCASSVVSFSSQFGEDNWSAGQALGEPDVYPEYGDDPQAWAQQTGDNQREYLVLGFDDPSPINYVRIYETYNPGAVDTIYVRNASTGNFEIVWVETAVARDADARINEIVFPETSYDVDQVRIALNSAVVFGYNEIDAVAIGLDESLEITNERTAGRVVAYSSQYNDISWQADQILGVPNVYPGYGDNAAAWATETQDAQREFIVLELNMPIPINFIQVFETYNPGAIDTVYVKNELTGEFEVVWSGTASPQPAEARIFEVTFPTTPYPVEQIRLAINSPAVEGWNELDAVVVGARTGVAVEPNSELPESYRLTGAYPNPFNPMARFHLSVDQSQRVKIEVFDVTGRLKSVIHDGILSSGTEHEFTLDASQLTTGMYVYRVSGEHFQTSRTAVVLK